MKTITHINSLIIFCLTAIITIESTSAQENFEVKWTMDYTQAGTSDHVNFTPASALLGGGPNTYTLPTVYSAGGAIGMGYVTRPWPANFSAGRYMEFSFTANSFKYDINRISFRLRRSNNGAKKVKVRSSTDGFAADLQSDALAKSDIFYTYTVPVNYKSLSNNTFAIRIYGYDATDIHGTFWFDEVIIAGKVLAIILPMSLTSFQASRANNGVSLTWQTSFERNGKEFVVARSGDMKHFEDIGTLPAAGDTEGSQTYHFLDTRPHPGTSYYRLRLIDRDGRYASSQVIDVITGTAERSLYVTPSPASPEKITISGQITNPATIVLQNMTGIAIPHDYSAISNISSILQPFSPLSPGIYILSFVENGRKEHVKILVR